MRVLFFASLFLAAVIALPLVQDQILQLTAVPTEPTLGFSYTVCSGSSDPTKLTALSVGPDPIIISKSSNTSVTVSGAGELDETITGASAKIVMKKKILGIWTEIPCVDNVGSCTYTDLCSMLPSGDCPPFMQQYGIPCHCPMAPFKVNIPSTVVEIPPVKQIPSFLAKGDYQVKATLTDSTGKEVICVQVEVGLQIQN
mmetsp:Transcript_23006/g.53768  ORF Transcript_23006/g.53768 Transcript_23006/m.53768 type:complete len:199 (+) Transcript_23006:1-597(+)